MSKLEEFDLKIFTFSVESTHQFSVYFISVLNVNQTDKC